MAQDTTTVDSKVLLDAIDKAEKNLDANLDGQPLKLDRYNLGPWSFSKAKVLSQCQYNFYLKYILKIKVPTTTDRTLANVGSTAHRILEHVCMGKSVDKAFQLTKQEFVEKDRLITPALWEERLVPVELSVSNFADKLDSIHRKFKVKRVLTEIRFGLTDQWEPTTFFGDNVWYRGILDLAIQLETPEGADLLCIDHKTGGGEFASSTKNYDAQLNSYKVAYHFGIEKLAGAQAGINFIKEGKLIWGDYSDKEEIEGKLKKTIVWDLDGAVDGVTGNGFFKHVRGNHCQYCDFNDSCRAGHLKDHEKTTKRRVIPIIQG